MSKEFRPHGNKLTTLESNVLKLRALEIVLVLYYMEDLKKSVIASFNVSKWIHSDASSDEKQKKGKKKKDTSNFNEARLRLLSEGIISEAEGEQISELVDFRNVIGHEIYKVTADVGPESHLCLYMEDAACNTILYKYDVVSAARKLRKEVLDRMGRKGYAIVLPFAPIVFSAAEKAYIKEIKSLRKKIEKGAFEYNNKVESLNSEIGSIPSDVMKFVAPGHPNNFLANGNLSRKGIDGIYMLFDNNLTPLAVSHLLRISYRAALRWYRRWCSGKSREAGNGTF